MQIIKNEYKSQQYYLDQIHNRWPLFKEAGYRIGTKPSENDRFFYVCFPNGWIWPPSYSVVSYLTYFDLLKDFLSEDRTP